MKDYKTAIQSHQQALQIRLKLFGENHADTARSYREIGLTQHSKHTMDDYKSALESYQQALIIKLKLYGESHPDTSKSYQDIELLRGDMNAEYVRIHQEYVLP